jgi:hypothetical protein
LRPLSAAGAANMLYLVACLNETLQHNIQWTNKCMQRNGEPCCYSIQYSYLNSTAYIRDNTLCKAYDSQVGITGSGTQDTFHLYVKHISYLILSYFQLVNTKSIIGVTMLKYHAMNASRTVTLHIHIRKWTASQSHGLLPLLNDLETSALHWQSECGDKIKINTPGKNQIHVH